MIYKRKIKPLIIFSLINLSSCMTIDTTEFSCSKTSSKSSINIEDLLKKSESITIDEKKIKLSVTINYIDKGGVILEFPSKFLPKFQNSCADGSSGYIYTLKDNKYSESLDSYTIERIWYINTKKEVWETSNVILEDYYVDPLIKKKFIVKDVLPNFRANYASDIIVKFKYKNNSYFLREKHLL